MNFYPVIGVLSAESLNNLYAVTGLDNDLLILMKHRAILLGIIGSFIVISAFRPCLQSVAIIAGFISMLSFIGLALGTGDYGEQINKVVLADVAGVIALVVVVILRWMNTRTVSR